MAPPCPPQTARAKFDSPSSSCCTSAAGQPQVGPTGKPTFKCEICGKELADASGLCRHRKIHNGEKPHQCDHCDRRFIRRYKMLQHRKVHEKEKVHDPADTQIQVSGALCRLLHRFRFTCSVGLSDFNFPYHIILLAWAEWRL